MPTLTGIHTVANLQIRGFVYQTDLVTIDCLELVLSAFNSIFEEMRTGLYDLGHKEEQFLAIAQATDDLMRQRRMPRRDQLNKLRKLALQLAVILENYNKINRFRKIDAGKINALRVGRC